MEILQFLAVVFLIVLFWLSCRASVQAKEAKRLQRAQRESERQWQAAQRQRARDEKAAEREARRNAPRHGPAPVYGRWRIRYESFGDDDGPAVVTERVVRILKVMPLLHHLECWCELRQARRTFALRAIERAVDEQTGEIIDLNGWMDAYRLSRRRARPPSSPDRPAAPVQQPEAGADDV